jgi:hypothetical protein
MSLDAEIGYPALEYVAWRHVAVFAEADARRRSRCQEITREAGSRHRFSSESGA